ncbi:cysteine-rich repeat secretory protein 60-like protein [Carex littledalei]|uniref:Cysteine-rich repeat secretory protein 60-like protein n=1 Tax=Carex littledalei TaxID=544730 RepID=A0A833QQK5_9POAL|nr:cysteine-rich repeat secretory protein 60-like protein [Carex littledalei]
MSNPNFTLLYLFIIISIFTLPVRADEDFNGFVYAGCSQPHYDPGSSYESSVNSILTSLSNAASSTTYTNITSPASTFVCGLFQCRSDLPVSYCDSCIHDAISRLSTLCPLAAGAGVQLRSCFLRYGNDSFLGKPDNNVLYKDCGAPPPNGGYNDAELPGMRDAALGALVAAAAPPSGGAYRIGGAGYVQAMSQCVGDLSANECSNCVGVAVAQLKTECSYASAGQVNEATRRVVSFAFCAFGFKCKLLLFLTFFSLEFSLLNQKEEGPFLKGGKDRKGNIL